MDTDTGSYAQKHVISPVIFKITIDITVNIRYNENIKRHRRK